MYSSGQSHHPVIYICMKNQVSSYIFELIELSLKHNRFGSKPQILLFLLLKQLLQMPFYHLRTTELDFHPQSSLLEGQMNQSGEDVNLHC